MFFNFFLPIMQQNYKTKNKIVVCSIAKQNVGQYLLANHLFSVELQTKSANI